MTLHPQASAHLDAVVAAGVPAIHEMSVREARLAGLGYLGLQRPPRPVATVTERFIPGPTADLPIRIYRPTESIAPGPAVLMLHGSGWVICNIDVCDEPARALALDSGLTVVTVNYQKAPEHPYPVPLDDCDATFQWVLDHAAELCIDPDRVALLGDSAGGNLTAALGLRRRDRGQVQPAALALLYPALSPRRNSPSHAAYDVGTGLSSADMAWFWRHYLDGCADTRDPYAAPLLARDLAGLPPTYVATAEHDVLRCDGIDFARRLERAGTPVTYEDFAGMIHGFYWMDAVLDDSLVVQARVAAWLRAALARPR